jgi:hypothetical protein
MYLITNYYIILFIFNIYLLFNYILLIIYVINFLLTNFLYILSLKLINYQL